MTGNMIMIINSSEWFYKFIIRNIQEYWLHNIDQGDFIASKTFYGGQKKKCLHRMKVVIIAVLLPVVLYYMHKYLYHNIYLPLLYYTILVLVLYIK